MAKSESLFFEEADLLLADLIPNIQDLAEAVCGKGFSKSQKESFLQLWDLTVGLKRLFLKYNLYLKEDVAKNYETLICDLQSSYRIWADFAFLLSQDESFSEEEKDFAISLSDKLLKEIVAVRFSQIEYLTSLANGMVRPMSNEVVESFLKSDLEQKDSD